MKKLDFIYFDAGGGHRSAANALKHVIEQQGRPWEMRLVNIQEILVSLDIFKKVTGIRSEEMYNLFLRKGWTLGSPTMLRMMHLLIRSYHHSQVRILREVIRIAGSHGGVSPLRRGHFHADIWHPTWGAVGLSARGRALLTV